MNKSESKIVIIVLLVFILVVIAASFGEDYLMLQFMRKYGITEEPIQVIASVDMKLPDRYVIDISNNYFEKQGKNQCSAFSCAFVLRNLGYNASGEEVFNNIEEIIQSGPLKGGVLFSGLINTFKDYGHELIMERSKENNVEIIIESVNKGLPIIVLIGEGTKWQHYTVVIGYDQDKQEIYFFDPDADGDLNDTLPGNRTYTYDKFLQYWNNGLPTYDRVFFETTKMPTLN